MLVQLLANTLIGSLRAGRLSVSNMTEQMLCTCCNGCSTGNSCSTYPEHQLGADCDVGIHQVRGKVTQSLRPAPINTGQRSRITMSVGCGECGCERCGARSCGCVGWIADVTYEAMHNTLPARRAPHNDGHNKRPAGAAPTHLACLIRPSKSAYTAQLVHTILSPAAHKAQYESSQQTYPNAGMEGLLLIGGCGCVSVELLAQSG
jgi:hypothetical protein